MGNEVPIPRPGTWLIPNPGEENSYFPHPHPYATRYMHDLIKLEQILFAPVSGHPHAATPCRCRGSRCFLFVFQHVLILLQVPTYVRVPLIGSITVPRATLGHFGSRLGLGQASISRTDSPCRDVRSGEPSRSI